MSFRPRFRQLSKRAAKSSRREADEGGHDTVRRRELLRRVAVGDARRRACPRPARRGCPAASPRTPRTPPVRRPPAPGASRRAASRYGAGSGFVRVGVLGTRRPRRRRRAGRGRAGSPRSPRAGRRRRSRAAPRRARARARARARRRRRGSVGIERARTPRPYGPRRREPLGRRPARRGARARGGSPRGRRRRGTIAQYSSSVIRTPSGESASRSERKCSGSLSTITPSKSKTTARSGTATSSAARRRARRSRPALAATVAASPGELEEHVALRGLDDRAEQPVARPLAGRLHHRPAGGEVGAGDLGPGRPAGRPPSSRPFFCGAGAPSNCFAQRATLSSTRAALAGAEEEDGALAGGEPFAPGTE